MTPTHIPPAMRGEGVPEWIVIVELKVGDVIPEFVRFHTWFKSLTAGELASPGSLKHWRARAATPTEITAARDGGRGDV